MSKIKLSYSKIDKFMTCQRAYYFNYIEKERFIPNVGMVLGSIWHKIIEYNLEQKVESGYDLELDDILVFFDDYFDNYVKNQGYIFAKEGIAVSDAKGMCKRMVVMHHKHLAPKIKPLLVEKHYWVETHYAKLQGFIDLVEQRDDKIYVCDNKSFGKSKSQSVLEKKLEGYGLQMSIYSTLFRINEGIAEDEMRWDVIYKQKCRKKKKPVHVKQELIHADEAGTFAQPMTIMQQATKRSEQDCNDTLGFIDDIAQDIIMADDVGRYDSNPRNNWCSEKWCSYWDKCKKKFK